LPWGERSHPSLQAEIRIKRTDKWKKDARPYSYGVVKSLRHLKACFRPIGDLSISVLTGFMILLAQPTGQPAYNEAQNQSPYQHQGSGSLGTPEKKPYLHDARVLDNKDGKDDAYA
jgi:hypothetical protein